MLVEWLNMAKQDASEIFLMGDVFDFWFEYKCVVPKGYTRLFGKLAEICDSGIKVHLFRGNHDIWAFSYLNEELGIEIHRKPEIFNFDGKKLYLAHGDGLGPGDKGYKFLKKVFEFKPNQFLFRWLHPDIGSRMGLFFSKRSRLAHIARDGKKDVKYPLADEMLYHYTRDMSAKYPDVDYFIFGHRHIKVNEKVNDKASLVILGDWITMFTYGVFENGELRLEDWKH